MLCYQGVSMFILAHMGIPGGGGTQSGVSSLEVLSPLSTLVLVEAAR